MQLLEGGIQFPLSLKHPILDKPQILCHLKGLVGSQEENLYLCCSTWAGQRGRIAERLRERYGDLWSCTNICRDRPSQVGLYGSLLRVMPVKCR